MMDNTDKIIVDKEKGTYLTKAQLRFFSNRVNALYKIKHEDDQYVDYCISCCAYNIINEYSNSHPDDVLFYWDEDHGFYYSFDKTGELAKSLTEKGFQLNGDHE